MYDDKELAKGIILAIIREAGGKLHNKTNLYKAFYYAHLEFARTEPGYLSGWPIVHMPNGPGIDWCDRLLGELVADGLLEIKQVTKGKYAAFLFVAAQVPPRISLPEGSSEAIKKAVTLVDGKTAETVSEESHRRAWERTKNGQEMDIYLDLQDDDEYRNRAVLFEKLGPLVDDIFGG